MTTEVTSDAQRRNVAVIRDLIETISEDGSEAVLARMEEFSDPEIEWRGVSAGRSAPGGDVVYRGYEGMRRFYAEYEETVTDIRFCTPTFQPIGDDVVLMRARFEWTARASGIPVEVETATVYVLRDGRVLSGENFFDAGEAEAAARRITREAKRAQA